MVTGWKGKKKIGTGQVIGSEGKREEGEGKEKEGTRLSSFSFSFVFSDAGTRSRNRGKGGGKVVSIPGILFFPPLEESSWRRGRIRHRGDQMSRGGREVPNLLPPPLLYGANQLTREEGEKRRLFRDKRKRKRRGGETTHVSLYFNSLTVLTTAFTVWRKKKKTLKQAASGRLGRGGGTRQERLLFSFSGSWHQ